MKCTDPTDRDGLLAQLAAYQPVDPADAARAARVAEFVRGHRACFSRTLWAGHVVASAWLLDRGRVLLHHHKKLDRWLQFGGHLDGDRSVLDAARRELAEESGVTHAVPLGSGIFDLDVHEIPARGAEPAHLHFDVRFAFRADADAPIAVSGESHALRWVPLEAVAELSPEPSLARMVAKSRGLEAAR